MFPTGGNGHAFISKSPATNGLGEAVSHGTLGAEIKRAGYDAIILTGKAEKPVYLWIDDDATQLMDAGRLWVNHPQKQKRQLKMKSATTTSALPQSVWQAKNNQKSLA
jgi:aldehyde:ferredoxin oxidoreductase